MALAYRSLTHSVSAFFVCGPELRSAEGRREWQSPTHKESFQSTLLLPWLFLSEQLGFIYGAAPHPRHCVACILRSGEDRWENRDSPSVSSELWFRSLWDATRAQVRLYRQDIWSEKASHRIRHWEFYLKYIHLQFVKVIMLDSVSIHDSE